MFGLWYWSVRVCVAVTSPISPVVMKGPHGVDRGGWRSVLTLTLNYLSYVILSQFSLQLLLTHFMVTNHKHR